MRFLFLAAISACVLSFTTQASAQPTWDHAGVRMNADSCVGAACLTTSNFNTTRTCTSLGGSWVSTCAGDKNCTVAYKYGRNPAATSICCKFENICNAQGERLPQEEIEAIHSANERADFESVFSPDTVESYWGYYSTSNRSPNAGRATSIAARLDVCIGSTDVDTAVANGVSWCQNTGCGAAANEYCEATGTNNGQTGVFAAVCKDRCECMINGTTHSTCDQL
jgi:hypothetical protein